MKLIPVFNNFKIRPPMRDDERLAAAVGMGDPKNWRAFIDGALFAQGVSRNDLIDKMRIRCTNIAVELDEYETWLNTVEINAGP